MVWATHKVLLPWLRNEPELIQMLQDLNGDKVNTGIRWMVWFGVTFRHVVLQREIFGQLVRWLMALCCM